MRIVVINHVTLDGVMQGPARADEDTRDGFTLGGWAETHSDDVLTQAWGERLGHSGGFLFGRRTYDDVLGHWNDTGGPFRDALNAAPKYVVSANGAEGLPWPNSTLITGDVVRELTELKQTPGPDLHVMGSGALIRSLSGTKLIDEYLLSIHPIVLGRGRRLFDTGSARTTLHLLDATPTSNGVVVATYRAEE